MNSTELQCYEYDLSCSDDEFTKQGITIGKNWVVNPNELEELYDNIDKKGALTLEWKCPGRRAPSPIPVAKETKPEIPVSPIIEKKYDFDFMDEDDSLKLRVRRQCENTLRGSAKKKTASFDGILSNIIRHKRIEQMAKQATPSSTISSDTE